MDEEYIEKRTITDEKEDINKMDISLPKRFENTSGVDKTDGNMKDNTSNNSNIDEIHSDFEEWISTLDLDDEEEELRYNSSRSPDAFHLSSDLLYRQTRYHEALDKAEEGLERYPEDINLLADAIKCSSEMGDFDKAREHYEKLRDSSAFNYWNEQAFISAFNFLFFSKSYIDNEYECREIISKFKKWHKNSELPYLEESLLEEAVGNQKASMGILKKAIKKLGNAYECSERLFNMEFKFGKWKSAVNTFFYYISMVNSLRDEDPSPLIQMKCLLAMDALLHKKALKGSKVSKREKKKIRRKYRKFFKKHPEMKWSEYPIENRIDHLHWL